MHVALTGGTGHLGGLIIRELHQRGHTIKALTRSHPVDAFSHLPIEWIKGDLENHDALNALMDQCDALIHCAGYISLQGDPGGKVYKTNVEGTRNVMDAAKKSGLKRVIHVSSIHAYEQHPRMELLDEKRVKTSARSFAYDRSKKEGEEIALSYASDSTNVLVMNPTSIISPFDDKPSKMGRAVIDLCSGKLPFVFSGGFDFCDGRDVATAITNGLTMGRSGEGYLLCGKWHTIGDLADMLSGISDKKIKPVALPVVAGWIGLPFIYLHGKIKRREPLYTHEALVAITDGNRHISSAKATKELNYASRPLEETLRDTWRWFKENGYLD
jgi:dihydroflavonol-4-reductase